MTKRNWQERHRVPFVTSGKSRVDQSQRPLSDINKIVARAKVTGEWPNTMGQRQPFYADFSYCTDLLAAYEVVATASEAFAALPAQLRFDLGNDPRNLEAWVSDPKNYEQAVRYGIIEEKEKDRSSLRKRRIAAREAAKGAGSPPKGDAATQPGKARRSESKVSNEDA